MNPTNDEIPSLKADRSALNIGRKKDGINKNIIIGIGAIITLCIVGAGGSYAFYVAHLKSEPIKEGVVAKTDFKAGGTNSAIRNSNYFTALKAEKLRAKKEEADRLKRLELAEKELKDKEIREREEAFLEKQRLAKEELEKQQKAINDALLALEKAKLENDTTSSYPLPIPAQAQEVPVQVMQTQQTVSQPQVATVKPEPKPPSEYELSIIRKKESGVLVDLGGNSNASNGLRSSGNSGLTTSIVNAQRSLTQRVSNNTGGNNSPFDDSFNASTFRNGQASRSNPQSLNYLLSHGTTIPCALYTQIISDYEGFVTCRVTQDVYSENGATLLIERGSLASGNQKVSVELGKARIFTTWSDISTPRGVKIRIDSLGVGGLGASGLPAWVNNHYMKRFGGAVLLSFIDDAFAIATDNEESDSYQNTANSTNDIASKILDSHINIKPTGYSKLGQKINIMLVRDVDMSPIYRGRGNL